MRIEKTEHNAKRHIIFFSIHGDTLLLFPPTRVSLFLFFFFYFFSFNISSTPTPIEARNPRTFPLLL